MAATTPVPLPRPIWIDIPTNQHRLFLVRWTAIYPYAYVPAQGSFIKHCGVIIGKYGLSLWFDSRLSIPNPFPNGWPTHNFQNCVVVWLYAQKITTCFGHLSQRILISETRLQRKQLLNVCIHDIFDRFVCVCLFVVFDMFTAVYTAGPGRWRARRRLKEKDVL